MPNNSNNSPLVSPKTLDKKLVVDQQGYSLFRLLRILREFYKGYRFIRKYKRAATFFGSARCGFADYIYRDAEELAYNLAKERFAIITGGGPGIMEAANKGAHTAGGMSVGLNIQLPAEQRINPYVRESTSFHYFFTRKVMLASVSQIYIFFPGGYGTLDELFEILTLVQTKRISRVAIILVNKEFWNPLIKWIEQMVNKENYAIGNEDLELFHVVEHSKGAMQLINRMILENRFDRPRSKRPITHNPEGVMMPGQCPIPGIDRPPIKRPLRRSR